MAPRFFVCALFLLTACKPGFYLQTRQAAERFENENPRYFHDLNLGQRRLHYLSYGNKKADTKIIFLHGAPGWWAAAYPFLRYPELYKRAWILAPDRVGYRGSLPHRPLESYAEQAKIYLKLFDLGDASQRVVLVGQSLGGTLAMRTAMEGDSRLRATILVSAPLDPQIEDRQWFDFLGALTKWFLPQELRIAQTESFNLKQQLLESEPYWSRVRGRVVYIHGMSDPLVKPENASYIRRLPLIQKPKVYSLPGEGHGLMWDRADFVARVIASEI